MLRVKILIGCQVVCDRGRGLTKHIRHNGIKRYINVFSSFYAAFQKPIMAKESSKTRVRYLKRPCETHKDASFGEKIYVISKLSPCRWGGAPRIRDFLEMVRWQGNQERSIGSNVAMYSLCRFRRPTSI